MKEFISTFLLNNRIIFLYYYVFIFSHYSPDYEHKNELQRGILIMRE